MRLAGILEAGKQDFLDALRGLTEAQASEKPPVTGWSALECIEHVITVEERYRRWLLEATPITPRRSPARESRLFTTIRNRLTKVEAPEVSRPHGRFQTLSEAIAEFNSLRDHNIELVQERGEALYAIGARHPFFGDVNGAELVQLIDGHARRHADQIREIREAFPATAKHRTTPPKKSKPFVFERRPPELPAELATVDDPLTSDPDSLCVQEKRLRDLEQPHVKLGTWRMEGCVLERVHLPESEFSAAVWRDVRLVGCNLANLRAHRIALVRVEFVDCRLIGFRATALDWQDVLIQNGDVRYAQLRTGKFRNCEFDSCNWEEADLQEADLSGSVFRSCNLTHADLQKTKLRNTDFRRSDLEGMLVGMSDLAGAIVEPSQAMILARVLGLQIR